MTAAGAIKGNINANVEANRIARTQKPMANEGSYVLGYIANFQHQIRVSERNVMYITYLGNFVGELWHAFRHERLPRAERVAKQDMQG